MLPPAPSVGLDSPPISTFPAIVSIQPSEAIRGGGKFAAEARSAELKVLHVVNGEHFSGAERVQSHLGRCLPLCGVTADFACVKPGRFAQMLREQGGKWGRGFEVPMKSRIDLRPALAIQELVESRGYNLLHAHTPRTALITSLVARLTGKPWIYHVHSPAARDSERRMTNRINAFLERRSLRRCHHRITVSQSLRLDCIANGGSPEAVSVVHNGVPAIQPVRESIPVPGGRWVLGMVALMRPRKGLEVALDALARLRASGHDVVLRCIGPFESSDYRAEIDRRIDALDLASAVELQGFTSDVPSALAKVDALVLPSLFGEGLPMVVLEAMAAGLPVIATEVEGTPEAITHGVEGLLAKPRDPSSLAEAIESLVVGAYDWSEMSDAAIARHRNSFSDLAMAEKTAEVYRSVLRQIVVHS